MLSLKLEGSASGFKGQPQASRVSLRIEGSASGLKAQPRASRLMLGPRLEDSGSGSGLKAQAVWIIMKQNMPPPSEDS